MTDPRGFAFPVGDVTLLLGWPEKPDERPTRANIAKGFAVLAAKAGPEDCVFILLSGHGSQVPIPRDQDPYRPEELRARRTG